MSIDIEIGKHIKADEGDRDPRGNVIWYDQIVSEYIPEAPSFPGAYKSAHINKIMIPEFDHKARNQLIKYFPAKWRAPLLARPRELGLFRITKYTIRQIDFITREYRAFHPEAVPTFETESAADQNLARLEVMRWWIRYALKTYGAEAYIIME